MHMIGHQYVAVNQTAVKFGDNFELLQVKSIVGWAAENWLAVVAAGNNMLGHAAYVVSRLSRQEAGVRRLLYKHVFWVSIDDSGKTRK